jgi:hypothetical protein
MTATGDSPLESTFRSWSWSRAPLGDGAAIFDDVEPAAAPPTSVALARRRGRACVGA